MKFESKNQRCVKRIAYADEVRSARKLISEPS